MLQKLAVNIYWHWRALCLYFKVVKLLLWRWSVYLSTAFNCVSLSYFYCLLLAKAGGFEYYLKKSSCCCPSSQKDYNARWDRLRIQFKSFFCLLFAAIEQNVELKHLSQNHIIWLTRTSESECIQQDWTTEWVFEQWVISPNQWHHNITQAQWDSTWANGVCQVP